MEEKHQTEEMELAPSSFDNVNWDEIEKNLETLSRMATSENAAENVLQDPDLLAKSTKKLENIARIIRVHSQEAKDEKLVQEVEKLKEQVDPQKKQSPARRIPSMWMNRKEGKDEEVTKTTLSEKEVTNINNKFRTLVGDARKAVTGIKEGLDNSSKLSKALKDNKPLRLAVDQLAENLSTHAPLFPAEVVIKEMARKALRHFEGEPPTRAKLDQFLSLVSRITPSVQTLLEKVPDFSEQLQAECEKRVGEIRTLNNPGDPHPPRFGGIGVELQQHADGKVYFSEVLSQKTVGGFTPAAKAGLKPGQVITKIISYDAKGHKTEFDLNPPKAADAESLKGLLSIALKAIRGDIGTKLELYLEGQTAPVSMQRNEINGEKQCCHNYIKAYQQSGLENQLLATKQETSIRSSVLVPV